MFDDRRLEASLAAAAETERAVRVHLAQTPNTQAGEHAKGLAAYRHAVALRRSLEDWIEMRRYQASVVEK